MFENTQTIHGMSGTDDLGTHGDDKVELKRAYVEGRLGVWM